MTTESYSTCIKVGKTANEIYHAITDVTNWWSKDFEGSSSKINDEFTIHHPGQHFSRQKLIEMIPGKKIVWLVTESKLDWLQYNKEEWTGTKMIFDIDSKGNTSTLQFTHEGLVPEHECYEMCMKGWDIIIKDWLYHLIITGLPSKEMTKAEEIRNRNLESIAKAGKNDFHRTIIVNSPRDAAMEKIALINLWWIKDFVGNAGKLNEKFTVPFGEPSFVDFVVSELVPGTKLVWKVTDCYLPWFNDKKEWNNTEVVFEFSKEEDKTKIEFTHVGLVPEIECYQVCEKGWNDHINTLVQLINEGKGLPE